MKPELAGKVAVITGGGPGLGVAMGRTFAGVGMAVAALDVDEAASKKTPAALAEEFGVPATGQPPRTVSRSGAPASGAAQLRRTARHSYIDPIPRERRRF